MNSLSFGLMSALLALLAIPAVAASAYLLALTILSRRGQAPNVASGNLRFDVIVPAHNESAVIQRCLASLSILDWPAARYRVIVIADNCDDSTSRLAHAAGAVVLERSDTGLRGKGYALDLGFARSASLGWADAVVIIDADSEVSPNLLNAFATRIESGAVAIQAHYGVLNADESWRTGLVSIAYGAVHRLRSRARERLQLSCGLRGNGWCVTHKLLRAVPCKAFSVTEDLEYGITLGLAGHRVEYADEASVLAEMESSERVARRQRQRWESGRSALLRSRTLPLLRAGLRERSVVCLDLALDLMVPPLSWVALNAIALLLLAAAGSAGQLTSIAWLYLGVFCSLVLVAYTLRGWQLSERGLAGLLDLMRAPYFVFWKLGAMLRRFDKHQWLATRRRGV